MTSPAEIVALLTRASNAYYNGGPLLLDDESFDTLVDELRTLDPTNPFLTAVGAPPLTQDAVKLPYPMPSLDKIKPGQGVLTRFIAKYPHVVLSEKLDGLSALWCPVKRGLYLRGNGSIGQSVSHLATHIQGLVPSTESWAIRGELILPRCEGKGVRAIVNGLLHQTTPSKEQLSRVRFIAYEVISPPGLTRQAQMEWLHTKGFLTPWWKAVVAITEDTCREVFQERRAKSDYETDGIVVGANTVTATATNEDPVRNPKDCVAFKMPVDDQFALTTVREVIWAPSAQGYLIPRLRFDPVRIGSATIEYCTAHNARTVVDRGLGPEARVKIRRSGDVIPTLDEVIFAATPSLPGDMSSWAWVDGPQSTHICSKKVTTEQIVSQLLHFAKTHSIPGLGPANCKILAKAGIIGPRTLWNAPVATLAALLGPKVGETTYKSIRAQLAADKLTELALMVGSSLLPRGVGETKLRAMFAQYPDPSEWSRPDLEIPAGWTRESLTELQAEYPKYEAWRKGEVFWIPYPLKATATVIGQPSKSVCFSGFRDKELESRLKAHGFDVAANVTRSLNILVLPDGDAGQSEKAKKAAAVGTIAIMSRSEFVNKYMPSD